MQTYSPQMRMCATCERRAGPSSINSSRGVITTVSTAVKGLCLGGAHDHPQTPPLASCAKHVKWSELR